MKLRYHLWDMRWIPCAILVMWLGLTYGMSIWFFLVCLGTGILMLDRFD